MPSSAPLPNLSFVIMEMIDDDMKPCAIRSDWESARKACRELAILYSKKAAGRVTDTDCGARFECNSVEYYVVEVADNF